MTKRYAMVRWLLSLREGYLECAIVSWDYAPQNHFYEPGWVAVWDLSTVPSSNFSEYSKVPIPVYTKNWALRELVEL